MLGEREPQEGMKHGKREFSEENQGQQHQAKKRWEKQGPEAAGSGGPVRPEPVQWIMGQNCRGLTVARFLRGRYFHPHLSSRGDRLRKGK